MPKLLTGRKFRSVGLRSSTTAPSIANRTTNEEPRNGTTGRIFSNGDTTTPNSLAAATTAQSATLPPTTRHELQPIRLSLTKITADSVATNKNAQAPTTKSPIVGVSKGQRKRLLKREQYMKKERMILSTLKLRKQDEQSKRIDGLDALKEALLDAVTQNDATADTTTPASSSSVPTKQHQHSTNETMAKHAATHGNSLKSNSSRHHLLHNEMRHMDLVLQHPTFQQDPLATIREHLQNTFPPLPPPPDAHHHTTGFATTSQSLDGTRRIRKRHKNPKFRATRTKRK